MLLVSLCPTVSEFQMADENQYTYVEEERHIAVDSHLEMEDTT